MRTLLVLLLLAAAGGAAALFLLRDESAPEDVVPVEGRDGSVSGPADGNALAADAPPPAEEWPPPPSPPPVGPEPDWRARILPLPGKGPVRGTDILQALVVDKGITLKARTPKDLAALEDTRFDSVDRAHGLHVATLETTLIEAGFEPLLRYPVIHFQVRPMPEPLPDPPR